MSSGIDPRLGLPPAVCEPAVDIVPEHGVPQGQDALDTIHKQEEDRRKATLAAQEDMSMQGFTTGYFCPVCHKRVTVRDGNPYGRCPHCKQVAMAESKSVYTGEGARKTVDVYAKADAAAFAEGRDNPGLTRRFVVRNR